MGIYSFRGGVHPKGYKELTADKPLVEYLPKGELVFPLSQHLGKPAIPVVKRNDLVKVGQLIAKADGFISANIHSSVSGKVKIIEHRPNNAGIMGESIVIINDGEYTPFEGVGEKTDYETALITIEEGPMPGNGAIGIGTDSYLWLTNNTGIAELKDYAILFDIRPYALEQSNSLYQANIKNTTDAGLFINEKGMLGRNTNGLGYQGELLEMIWHRILYVVKDGCASVYIDGDKVGQSTSANSIWSMMPEALLFADDSGEEVYNDVAEIRFWDVPLTDEQVKSLGGIEQEWDDEPFIDPVSVWTFDNPNDLMAGTGEAVLRPAMRGDGGPVEVEDPAPAGIVPIAGPTAGNGAALVPFDSYLQMAHNQESEIQNSFTFLMDIRPKSLSGYNVIIQTNPARRSEGQRHPRH